MKHVGAQTLVATLQAPAGSELFLQKRKKLRKLLKKGLAINSIKSTNTFSATSTASSISLDQALCIPGATQ